MKARIPIDVVVGVLGGVSCLVALPGLGFPVWALFIGWAWYFALGATPAAIKQIYPAILPGAVLAAVCIWLINVFSQSVPVMPAMIIAVIITVFLLMLALRIPIFNCSLSGFNAYSTMFATFYGGFFPQTGEFGHDLIFALIWGMVGNALGPLFGYLSIFFTFPKKDDKDANTPNA